MIDLAIAWSFIFAGATVVVAMIAWAQNMILGPVDDDR